MKKYVRQSVRFAGKEVDVVGYYANMGSLFAKLIIDASQVEGWAVLGPYDVVFKECKLYWYIIIDV